MFVDFFSRALNSLTQQCPVSGDGANSGQSPAPRNGTEWIPLVRCGVGTRRNKFVIVIIIGKT